jgi:DNA transformation protein
MFAKTGVFCDSCMLMVRDNTLYFRVDDGGRAAFREAGRSAARLRQTAPPSTFRSGARRASFDGPDEFIMGKTLGAAQRVAASGRCGAGRKAKLRR